MHVVSFPNIPWNVMPTTSHFLQTWLQFFLWTSIYYQQQISLPCECWKWEKVDEKFNSVALNWLRNRILCGSLKSLLWIGYNQNLKRSGWENSFLVGHLSNMTPVRFSAEKKINNGNTKSTISTNTTAHSHTYNALPACHSDISNSFHPNALSDWCFGDLNDVTLVGKESCQLSNRDFK